MSRLLQTRYRMQLPSAHEASWAKTQTGSPFIASTEYPTDELCSRALINILMVDYLDLVYPLVPVVHRPSFRRDLAANRDITDPDFFALLISLAALTVGLLPSRFRGYRAVDLEAGRRFETRTALINCCAEICTRQRTASYWDHVNHRKWAVCYVLSVACFQTGQVNRSRMFDVEYLQLSRLLGLHSISEYEGLNFIETHLRKKAFWLLFYSYAHNRVQNGRWDRLTYFGPGELREINFEALMPLEIDDEQVFRDRILDPVSPMASRSTPSNNSQERHVAFTLSSGFNLHSRVFLKGLREAMETTGCECELRRSPVSRLARLRELLQEMRYMLDDAPGPMRQWASSESYDAPGTPSYENDQPAMSNYGSPVDHSHTTESGHSASVIQGQAEIMRANIHVTHLWLQSLLLEKVEVALQDSALGNSSATAREEVSAALKASWAEREDICRQMLHLLHSIPYIYLEPNGLYLAYKVRDVAVTLLNCPFEAHERPARRAVEYMRDFTRALSRLDRSETVNTNSLKSWVDVDREPAA
ncbi:quinate utilization pathway activator [Colletotrichum tofieldiae]|uniref:Quinate utilization pathway activator n=1 Tax=Colletotrichum tofieldiae TaxID=708197 RepID=A0A166WX17_9PEZI|nr:quinate utilization pathway activator [Colletotrichum tofieldiae]